MQTESIHEDGYDDKSFVAATTDDPNDTSMVATGEGGEAQNISEEGQVAPVETGASTEDPATVDDGAADDGKPDAAEKTVPYGALHAEREMRKETQSQLLETQRALGQMQGLKDQLDALREDKTEVDTTEADKEAFDKEFDEDPIGALRKQNEQLQIRLDSQDTKEKDAGNLHKEQQQQQQQFNGFMNEVTSQVADFEKDNPDYPMAFKHLMDLRMEEMKVSGVNPNQMEAIFNREAISLAQGAIQNGKNPAEVAYGLAKVRGYVKTDAKPNSDGNTAQPAGETLEQQMLRLEAGQKASSTLTGGTGGTGDTSLSLTDISTMSDKEFDNLWNDMSKQSIHE